MAITHLGTAAQAVEHPYEAFSLAELVEQAEFQYDDGSISFELVSELVRRAEAAERP